MPFIKLQPIEKCKKFLFIIPARSNSKRLVNKNIKKFNGKPLIYWTIEQAIRFNNYGFSVLTTDSENIIKECSSFQDILIIKRPKYLATDKANLIDVALSSKKIKILKFYYTSTNISSAKRYMENGIKHLNNGANAVRAKVNYNILLQNLEL